MNSSTLTSFLGFNSSNFTDLLDVVIRDSNSTDFSITRISRSEYLNIPNKTSTGRPSQFFYDRQITPTINLWPTPDSSDFTLVYYFVNRIQDADTLQNTTDAPFRFLPCMVAGLAYQLSMKYPQATPRMPDLKAEYEFQWDLAQAEDRDRASVHFVPGGY